MKVINRDSGPIFQVTNLNRNLTQFRHIEIHCQLDPTERNGSQPEMCFDRRKATLESGVFIKMAKLEILSLKSP